VTKQMKQTEKTRWYDRGRKEGRAARPEPKFGIQWTDRAIAEFSRGWMDGRRDRVTDSEAREANQ
jgi:hypothetical protein